MNAKRQLILTCVAAVATIVGAKRALAQAQCKPANAESAAGLASLKKFVVATDAESVQLRKKYHIEGVAPAAVTYVTDPNVCYFAVVAYNAVETTTPAATDVYMYQLGNDMYVVDAAKGPAAKTRSAMLFSALWAEIGKLNISTGK